jgi:hypothetical protein
VIIEEDRSTQGILRFVSPPLFPQRKLFVSAQLPFASVLERPPEEVGDDFLTLAPAETVRVEEEELTEFKSVVTDNGPNQHFECQLLDELTRTILFRPHLRGDTDQFRMFSGPTLTRISAIDTTIPFKGRALRKWMLASTESKINYARSIRFLNCCADILGHFQMSR